MPDSVERREDLDTRDRVADVLFAVVQDRKRQRKTLRIMEWVMGFQTILLIAVCCTVAGFPGLYRGLIGQNSDRIADIQQERKRNIRANCKADNAQARRQERALTKFRAGPETRRFVRAILPQRRDCDRVVAKQIPSAKGMP